MGVHRGSCVTCFMRIHWPLEWHFFPSYSPGWSPVLVMSQRHAGLSIYKVWLEEWAQLSSYLIWEVMLKCRPSRSRTLDVVRPVCLLNAFFFFCFFSNMELKVGVSSILLPENAADFTVSFSVLPDATLCSALAVSLLWGKRWLLADHCMH